MDYKHFVSTRPSVQACGRIGCDALILVGYADGLSFKVELDPINRAGELAAIWDNLATYETIAGRLKARGGVETAARSADNHLVLVTHRCGRAIPTGHRPDHPPDRTAQAIAAVKQLSAGDRPPF